MIDLYKYVWEGVQLFCAMCKYRVSKKIVMSHLENYPECMK